MRPRFALAACGVAFHALPAKAAEPEPVRFSYEAAAGCPSQDEFLDTVARDGGLLGQAGTQAPARTFTVTLERGPALLGRLVVKGIDGREATRTIQGERCEDVARSLAVLVALSLEPRPEIPPPPSASPTPVEAPGLADAPRAAAPPPVERWRLGLSAEGTLSGGASPGLLAGIALYAELAHDSPRVFAPALRLGFETTATGSADTPNGSAPITFSRQVARADACPFRFTARRAWASDAVSADACARLDAGVLGMSGARPPSARTAEYAWAAAGALLRFRWVAPPVFFDLEVGAVVPLVRERFYVEPGSVVFEVPPVAGVGGIGLGAYFL
jgi:hypothetical protein